MYSKKKNTYRLHERKIQWKKTTGREINSTMKNLQGKKRYLKITIRFNLDNALMRNKEKSLNISAVNQHYIVSSIFSSKEKYEKAQ